MNTNIRIRIIPLLLLAGGIFASCHSKKPKACITVGQQILIAGRECQVSSCSENAFSYLWTVNDSRPVLTDQKEFSFTPALPGTYKIGLQVNNKGCLLTDYTTVTLRTACDTASVMFWLDDYGTEMNIYVDSLFVGTITNYYTAKPSCGASGCVTVAVTAGEHLYYSKYGNPLITTASTSFNATSCGNECDVIQLHQ